MKKNLVLFYVKNPTWGAMKILKSSLQKEVSDPEVMMMGALMHNHDHIHTHILAFSLTSSSGSIGLLMYLIILD